MSSHRLRVVEDTDQARDLAQELAYKRAIALQKVTTEATQSRGILRNADSRQGLHRQPAVRGSQYEVTYADQERDQDLLFVDSRRDFGDQRDYSDQRDYRDQRDYDERRDYGERRDSGERRDYGEHRNITHESYMDEDRGREGHDLVREEVIEPQYSQVVGDRGMQHGGQVNRTVTTTRVTHHSTRHHGGADEREAHGFDERGPSSLPTMYAGDGQEYSGHDDRYQSLGQQNLYTSAHDQQLYTSHTGASDQPLYTGLGAYPGSMQLQDYQGPPDSRLSPDDMVAASARVVNTEHVTWTETKHVRKIDDYGDV